MSPSVPISSLDPTIAARLKRDEHGLFPAVAQQAGTGEVLMVGWMDDEALARTLASGRVTYWSRSRREYWVKGETTGHRQWVSAVALDCDGDTVLVTVDQEGPACHTGERTCFDAAPLPAAVIPPEKRAEALRANRATPDLDEFRALAANRRVIPVTRRLLADSETPVGLYRKLAQERPGTFLLESAEHGVWSRYSIVGVRAVATLTERDGQAHWLGNPPVGLPTGGDPLQAIAQTLAVLHTEALPGLPPLTGGLVGMIGYDAVRRLERLPELAEDDLHLPEIALLLATDLAVLDHSDGSVLLIANALNADDTDERVDEAWSGAVARLDAMTADLGRPAAATATAVTQAEPHYDERTPRHEYLAAIEAAKEEIRAGEAFQIVVSQRFSMTTQASALDVYRVLRATNPSPYMYLVRFDGFDVVGSSPEALVTVNGGRATMHPIAGSRPRGATPEQDADLAEAMLADDKERSEHLMLVDLGRNDLGRVCRAGSVEVVEFMAVERYSHIMHIVSTVLGELDEGRTAFDAVLSCFPAGTLSGAPKPRAMEIIERLEPTRRGLYGGIVGYLDFAGDADTAIAIRTAVLRNGVAYVQAGAGIVADSDPVAEDAESRNKAAAVLRAIAAAETLAPVGPAGRG